MSPVPEDHTLAPWRELGESLAGSFSARAQGLLASDFALLDPKGREIGRLKINESEGADLVARDLRARIERTGPKRYAMLDEDARILSAEQPAGSPGAMRIRRAEHVYEVSLSLLRNTAEALSPAKRRAARAAGGLTNRRYEVAFDVDDAGALPVAVFLLYRLVALRRGAYRAGGG